MDRVKIRRGSHGVDFVWGERWVRVDTTAHVVRLASHAGEKLELGALRSGLLTSMGFVLEQLQIPPLRHDLSPAADAVERALAEQAKAKGLRDDALEAGVFAVARTPLLYAAPFLEARWVWQDALRFRACRVAVANAEDDFIDEDSAATAVAVVEKLGKWRDLYSPEGKSKRALNTALNDFGETMPASALWGLRKVSLNRPRTKREHLDVLGWLGALPAAPGLDKIIEVVERANDDELDASLARVKDARALAQLLAEGDAESTTLLQLHRSATARSEEEAQAKTRERDFPAPLIPLPDIPGLKLISTSDDLRADGEAMHHCVFHLAGMCRRGDAFVFHAEQGGTHGTIHVDGEGNVVEARGPFNRPSLAADWGARVLREWSVGLWWRRLEPTALAWRIGMEPPPTTKALRNVREILAAYQAMTPTPALRDFFAAMTRLALRGGCGLVSSGKTVFAVGLDGRLLGDTEHLEERRFLRGWYRGLAHVAVVDDTPWHQALPLPPPKIGGIGLVTNPRALRALDIGEDGFTRAELETGAVWLFQCHPDRGTVCVAVRAATLDVRCVSADGVSQGEIDWAVGKLRQWTWGFWAVRLGMQRNAWLGAMRSPPGCEPLETVERCSTAYALLVDNHGDRAGKLAAWFEKHVDAAVRGNAWLVSRDGEVMVLDRKRSIVTRSSELT